jgi:uncharacterized membrane protein YsdA (DUF1294 family)
MNPWLWILAWYGLMSVATFAAYRRDKRAAARRDWRVRERTLHVLELLGGWPGALAAQRLLRHKTRDLRYLAEYWGIVAIHIFVWAVWLWRSS